ncbi:MAG: exosortase [Verrucomicrobiota bacterium]
MAKPLTVEASRQQAWILTAFLGLAGFVLWQFFGNNVRTYVDTSSIFVWWTHQWTNPRSQTEYGPVVLLAAIGLSIWNWRRSPEVSVQPRIIPAGILLMSGLGLHAGGLIVEQARLSIIGLLVFINGLAWLAGGTRAGRATAFPLAFMLFALPLEFLFDEFGFFLRLAVIQSATAIAHLLGIEVIRNGTHLVSPDGSFNYDVEPACSGIRSLVALAALSLLVGYCCFRSWWRRGLLFFLAFPFAYVGNVIRIFAIIIAAEWFGQDAGLVVHEWFGFLVFVIVLGFALATVSALEKWLPEKVTPQGEKKPIPALKRSGLIAIASLVILGIGLSIALASKIDSLGHSAKAGVRLARDKSQPVALPAMLGIDWVGRSAPVSEIERKVLPPDTGYSRSHYLSLEKPGDYVYFSIVLSGGGRAAIHRPEICLVGQGWTIEGKFFHEFSIPGMTGGLKATVLEIERTQQLPDGTEQRIPGLFAYWFVGQNRIAATNSERLAWFAWDRLTRLQSHRWAYLFAQTDSLDGTEPALERLQTVIAQVVPEIQTARIERGSE